MGALEFIPAAVHKKLTTDPGRRKFQPPTKLRSKSLDSGRKAHRAWENTQPCIQLATGIKPRTFQLRGKGADYSPFYYAKTLSQISRPWCNFLPFLKHFFNKKRKLCQTHFLNFLHFHSNLSQTGSARLKLKVNWELPSFCDPALEYLNGSHCINVHS